MLWGHKLARLGAESPTMPRFATSAARSHAAREGNHGNGEPRRSRWTHVLYPRSSGEPHSFRMASQPGMHRPPNCTALGKGLAGVSPQRATPRNPPHVDIRASNSAHHPKSARFRKELARVVQQSLADGRPGDRPWARCVAAPVLDESGKVAAAISVSGPITRMSRDRIQAFALATKKAARTISAVCVIRIEIQRWPGCPYSSESSRGTPA